LNLSYAHSLANNPIPCTSNERLHHFLEGRLQRDKKILPLASITKADGTKKELLEGVLGVYPMAGSFFGFNGIKGYSQ
jgi:hypothetical protein